MHIKLAVMMLVLCTTVACKNTSTTANKICLMIHPFEDLSRREAEDVHLFLKDYTNNVYLGKTLPFPSSAWNAARKRYRADSLLKFLLVQHRADTISIGLTHYDISTTKKEHLDWGVMGLGYRPGRSCIISSYRLSPRKNTNQFKKVTLHEIGHTLGLEHCKMKTCLMRDAEGKNPLDEEKEFCVQCKSFLRSKGFGR
jgi:archaemetzincin